MVRLSVNVNKVATLRNARGAAVPSVLDAVRVCLDAGVKGITVHPRKDERHITTDDVHQIADLLAPLRETIEYNIEGDPRPGLVELVQRVRPHQCTLVPVRPGEITSEAGWDGSADQSELAAVVGKLREAQIRVSLFVDPDLEAIAWAKSMQADRVELYTEPYARAHARGGTQRATSLALYRRAAEHAVSLGLGVNAGHDLDLENLADFAQIPGIDEVSIGHALVSRAVFVGLGPVCREYLDVLARQTAAAPS